MLQEKRSGSGGARWLGLALAIMLAVLPTAGAERNPPLSTAELLVDLARDYGLTQRETLAPADFQHVAVLLKAASRLNPSLPAAHELLCELSALMKDDAGTLRRLDALLRVDPAHEAAFERWLELSLASRSTVEERTGWLRSILAQSDRSPRMQARVRAQLARLRLEQLDREGARREIEEVWRLAPGDADVARLRMELIAPQVSAEEQLRATLALLACSPLDAEAAWRVATILAEAGLIAEAGGYYERAIGMHRASQPGAPAPAEFWLQYARNQYARGQFDAAIESAQNAIQVDPAIGGEAGWYLHWMLFDRGRTVEAEAVRDRLKERFAAIREPAEWPVNELAQAAWFYGTLDLQQARAIALAEAAAARSPGDPFVTRALGFAQAASGRDEEAARTLRSIAGKDAFAACRLSRMLSAAGNEQDAREALEPHRALSPTEPAGKLVRERLKDLGMEPLPPAPPDAGIGNVLAGFGAEILDFAKDPAKHLSAEIQVEDRSPAPGEPWWAVFTLTNRTKSPITLGPDGVVNPVLLVSIAMEGEKKRDYRHLIELHMDRARVLGPGESVQLRRTLDVGPPRRFSRQTPQQMQRVTVTAILDPERGADGEWRPSASGQLLRPAYFNRLPASVEPETFNVLFGGAAGDSDAARFRAIELLAELLGEKQRSDAGRLGYRPAPIPVERVYAALLGLLESEQWETRVRTLDAMMLVGLDRRMVDAVERCLDHPHWLVRLMAVRLLARQGAAFLARAESIARDDQDDLVREMAACYVERWRSESAVTQPAPRPAGDNAAGTKPGPKR
jgi:tetratricopeptide (TPR) repeat protein